MRADGRFEPLLAQVAQLLRVLARQSVERARNRAEHRVRTGVAQGARDFRKRLALDAHLERLLLVYPRFDDTRSSPRCDHGDTPQQHSRRVFFASASLSCIANLT